MEGVKVRVRNGVHSIYIVLAVVEAVEVIQDNMHCNKSIRTIKTDGTWPTIFKTRLDPRVKYVA